MCWHPWPLWSCQLPQHVTLSGDYRCENISQGACAALTPGEGTAQDSETAGRATCGHGAATGLGVRDGQGEATCASKMMRLQVGVSGAGLGPHEAGLCCQVIPSSQIPQSESGNHRIVESRNSRLEKNSKRHLQSDLCPDRRKIAAH